MKFGKDLALMSLGAAALLAYQKYNKPVKRKMEQVMGKTMKKTNDKLENMR